jgi:hypothetical protein
MSLKLKELHEDYIIVVVEGYFGPMAIKEKHELKIPLTGHKKVEK